MRGIERIGTTGFSGVRAIEAHVSDVPDGNFLRLPIPDVVVTINLGVVGWFRPGASAEWSAFPRVAVRGVCVAPSEGRDPATGRVAYVSVIIEPWALRAYLGIDARFVAERITNALEFCPALHVLHDTVASSTEPRKWLTATADWLHERLSRSKVFPSQRRVIELLRDGHDVAGVAPQMGISVRRVHQLCCAATGHNPSTYRQIARFAAALKELHAAHPKSSGEWSAAVAAYADHSHAIRSFRRHASVTPRAYAVGRLRQPRAWSILPIDAEREDH